MYPTKEKILEKPVRFKKGTIALVNTWKKAYPKPDMNEVKELLIALSKLYGKPLSVGFDSEIPSAYYNISLRHIVLKDKSIISALHEFAHHIYGSSETQACRWSVWLFMKLWPKKYEKLEWKGHMLVKPKIINQT